MENFIKSEILAYRQCKKRFWLEKNKPELRVDAQKETSRIEVGIKLKAIARRLYDPANQGTLVELGSDGYKPFLARSRTLLNSSQPIFDAGFETDDAKITADIMMPSMHVGNRAWRLIHVRSSTIVRDHHHDDIAVQAFVARRAGVPLIGITLAHIDSNWTYRGNKNYRGLLAESDMTSKAFGRDEEIRDWIWDAKKVLNSKDEPTRDMGRHCNEPHACGFQKYCSGQEQPAEYPVNWLPRSPSNDLRAALDIPGTNDMRQVPNSLLNERQRRVKEYTISGAVFYDGRSAAADLARYTLPACFIAFETIQFALPTWPNTRPFQPIPFQFSIHWLGRQEELEHDAFIDLSGTDPSLAFAEALIAAVGKSGTIFAYNAGFEMSRIRELADRFPNMRSALMAINERMVDLLKIAELRYYNPIQEGSWSLKKILPAIAPEMMSERLKGIKDGTMATNAYLEAIEAATPTTKKDSLKEDLLNYCRLDTLAMVELWHFFSGKSH